MAIKRSSTGKKKAVRKRAVAKRRSAPKRRPAPKRKHPAARPKARAGKRRSSAGGRGALRARHSRPRAALKGKRLRRVRPRLTPDYRPSENEPFMNPVMIEYFRQKLLKWREGLLTETNETLQLLQESGPPEADLADRATTEVDRTLQLRTRDRARKLILKIDDALRRIDNGSYGYCEETHEPISLRRLEARPIATLSIEAQERHERLERTRRED